MADYPFLDYHLKLYDQHLDGWKREERRLHGGDAVLTELVKWKAEDQESFTGRSAQSGYLTFPKIHASTLTGHLSRETPPPQYGNLGNLRPRADIKSTPSLAEVLHYNVDGIGQDGTELMPWFDGVQERAIATGFRWVMVEMPTSATLSTIREVGGRTPEGLLTAQDVLDGFRPYAVEYSPISVPFWQFSTGRLDFAVIKTRWPLDSVLTATGEVTEGTDGSYLLVRAGYKGLGSTFSEGGWWKFDEEQNLMEDGHGLWTQTKGQIPFFLFIGEPDPGTTERPAVGRSLTMELGQIAVSLMNRMSERNYNVMYAAKSINYILGINPAEHSRVIQQQDDASITVGVPPVLLQDGTVGMPTMWNSSAAAIDAPVFESVIRQGIDEAREIMVKQVSSTPDSSGRSKEAGFAEATSPLLARLAGTRQTAMNTFLYFASLRFGIPEPTASVTIPRDFNLQPVVDDIDAMLQSIKLSALSSPTWETHLLIRAGDERGLMPEDAKERKVIEGELEKSAQMALDRQAQVNTMFNEISGNKPTGNGKPGIASRAGAATKAAKDAATNALDGGAVPPGNGKGAV